MTKPFALLALTLLCNCAPPPAPAPVGPLPSERQLSWQQLEYYAFIHFNMNTFTNMEWGMGDESPQSFNPTELDTRQWARVANEAGMKGIIITAKHHDGFCLWPTETTEHSVKNSSWKGGKGDLLKELAEACREYGLKFGVYLSPWDRNHPEYGKEAYVEVFHTQLRELLTNYGELFEVWFDGANGGTGYYGGANESRKIDNKTYYQWERATALVRELQPNAVIFSDGGPDIRWVGNEEGWADKTNWSIMRRDEIYPGWPRYIELRSGHEDGTHWLPAEADVSIRPGWYYHPSEDHRVKTLPQLLDIYYRSVGRNASLLLNLPVDTRGLVHETDVAQLMALKEQLELDFKQDLARVAEASASSYRGSHSAYSAEMAIDGDKDTYWATDDSVSAGSLTLDFPAPQVINRVLLQEHIALGQRVKDFSVEAQTTAGWEEVARETTIGYKRILRIEPVTATAIRINILDAKGPPLISNISLYNAPRLLLPPTISRDREGMLRLQASDAGLSTYYTLDGTEPGPESMRYKGPFPLQDPATVKAQSILEGSGESSALSTQTFDISKGGFRPLHGEEALLAVDDNPKTFWESGEGELKLDLGQTYNLSGFTYWPMQERWQSGLITEYEFSASNDGRNWKVLSSGEFSNIVNNPVEQAVRFSNTRARYIRLKALKIHKQGEQATFGELGIITTDSE